jgi:hypothetical protein
MVGETEIETNSSPLCISQKRELPREKKMATEVGGKPMCLLERRRILEKTVPKAAKEARDTWPSEGPMTLRVRD